MNNERDFDGIRVGGVPLAEVLKDQRDTRVIEHRSREVFVMNKCRKKHKPKEIGFPLHKRVKSKDSKPGKVHYFSYKKIEEEAMQRDIKKVEAKGLPKQEVVYLAFQENNWKPMRSTEIAYAVGTTQANISSVISKMKSASMLVREKKGVKIFYTISPEIKEIGRVGWGNMYREVDNKIRKQTAANKKGTKKLSPASPITIDSSNPASESSNQKLANKVHALVEELNLAVGEVRKVGLKVEVMHTEAGLTSRVFKEY